jgi:hypothetical protein
MAKGDPRFDEAKYSEDDVPIKQTTVWSTRDANQYLNDTTNSLATEKGANPHLFAIWSHLTAMGNYAPMVNDHIKRTEVTRHANEGLKSINSADAKYKNTTKIPLVGKAVESLGMATNALVKHLGPNHPISQEALANHAGAIAAHSAFVEKNTI